MLVAEHQAIRYTHVEVLKYIKAWGSGLPEARVRRKPKLPHPDRAIVMLPSDTENVSAREELRIPLLTDIFAFFMTVDHSAWHSHVWKNLCFHEPSS